MGRKNGLVLKSYMMIVGTSVLNEKPHSFHVNDVIGYNLQGAMIAPSTISKIVSACSLISPTGPPKRARVEIFGQAQNMRRLHPHLGGGGSRNFARLKTHMDGGGKDRVIGLPQFFQIQLPHFFTESIHDTNPEKRF